MAVARWAEQAVAHFHRAVLTAFIAREGFAGASGGGLFDGLFSHSTQSPQLLLMQGGRVGFQFAMMVHHLFGDPNTVE